MLDVESITRVFISSNFVQDILHINFPDIDVLLSAGAYLNGISINVLPHNTELEDSTVSVGFPSKVNFKIPVDSILLFHPQMRIRNHTNPDLLRFTFVQLVSLVSLQNVCAFSLKELLSLVLTSCL